MIFCVQCEERRENQLFGVCDDCYNYDDSEEYRGEDE